MVWKSGLVSSHAQAFGLVPVQPHEFSAGFAGAGFAAPAVGGIEITFPVPA
jgi:hypothetical protein